MAFNTSTKPHSQPVSAPGHPDYEHCHINPVLHQSEHDFFHAPDPCIQRDIKRAIVFEGLDFFLVWFLLMTGNYRKLARHFVRLDDTFKSDDEVVAFLKERVKKF